MKAVSRISGLVSFGFLLLSSGCYFSEEPYNPVDPKDDVPPRVEIVYPLAVTEVAGEVLIRALATDNEGIQKVVLYVDGLPQLSEDYEEPFEVFWNTWNYPDLSEHAITVRAYDHSENMADSDPLILKIN